MKMLADVLRFNFAYAAGCAERQKGGTYDVQSLRASVSTLSNDTRILLHEVFCQVKLNTSCFTNTGQYELN